MLEVENLEVVYEDVILVLKGVSLSVPDGAIVALLGANGAGKTTVLRAITGLLDVHRGDITKGSITFNGYSITHMDAPGTVAQGIAQVMEGRRVFAELTVEENLKVGGYAAGRARQAPNLERVYATFPILEERRTQTAGLLSGGEQQMLAIGRALMAGPRLLLLDEPSLGLAPIIVESIFGVLEDINSRGVSILLVEQNAMEALDLAGRGYVLEEGRIVGEGPARALADDERLRKAYLGL
ncbi:MAG: ABC transporter ATP-binding protein [Nitriliruptorales bacterium]|nr:ABC transporter ATP-binding protein [Nitriliruptorales bacterium]